MKRMFPGLFTAATAFVAAVSLLFAPLTLSARTPTIISQRQGAAMDRWVDSVYNSMTDRERIAQLIFPKLLPGKGTATRAVLQRLVGKNGVGGLLFEKGKLSDYAEMINYAQSLAKVPLLNTFDGEWGLAMRIADMPCFPINMGLGAIDDEKLLYQYGHEVARECRELGIQVNFAPVADVNSNPANPVIGYRSFGEDPARVARMVAAYSRGLEDGGVQAVAKHFPGHGDTDTDSHRALPVVNHSQARLDSVDLVPFRSFISSGGSGVMTAHISVPAIDPTGTPASLSKPITTGWLRDRLGFEGLIYTDALSMKGATVDGQNNALLALEAGADVLLSTIDPASDIDAIYAALRSGRVPRSVIEDRCKRVLRYKYALGLPSLKPVEFEGLADRINCRQAVSTADQLADASVTVLRNRGDLLPLALGNQPTIIAVSIGAEAADGEFARMASRYAPVEVINAPQTGLTAAQIQRLRKADVVVALIGTDAQWARSVLQSMGTLPGRKAYAFLIHPYKMNKFHASLAPADALLTIYDNLPSTRRAAAKALFGGLRIDGTLPVDLPRVAPIGSGIVIPQTRLGYTSAADEGMHPWLTDSIDAMVGEAIAAGAFPGCQVLVARHGNVVVDRSYGHLTAGGAPVTPLTRYDLASVSKCIGTLPGVMRAYDLGLIDLDAKAVDYVPGLAADSAKDFTVRQLLFHETGMQPSLSMFYAMIDTASYDGRLITSRRDAKHTIKIQEGAYGHRNARLRSDLLSAARDPRHPVAVAGNLYAVPEIYDTIMTRIYTSTLAPNRNYRYSCLNFCLLMDAEQHVTQQPHQQWLQRNFTAPLGAYTMTYCPAEQHDGYVCAPTEYDAFLRRQVVDGYVHDELAAFSGGVQGNAGLFACANDVAKMCRMWQQGGVYGPDTLLSEPTVRLFTTTKSSTCRRGLGFDRPNTDNPDMSPTCPEAGAAVYGHTGFTGTCFWIDPDRDLIFVFLCNRVNPTRDNRAFSQANIRDRVFSAVYHSLID